MKSTVIAALLAIFLPMVSATQQASPIRVSISAPSPEAKSGAQVRINVTVENISGNTVELYKALGPDGQAEAANEVDVYDSDGKALFRIDGRAFKANGQIRHLPKQWISRKTVPLEPGKSSEDFLILGDLFDMTKPGHYTVKVRHQLQIPTPPSEDRMIEEPSNTITITVLPADDLPPAKQ
jgi:hypothetical protein